MGREQTPKDQAELNQRIERSLQRIDDKFNKLNNNLQKYQQSLNPAKQQLHSDSLHEVVIDDSAPIESMVSLAGLGSMKTNARGDLNTSRPVHSLISEGVNDLKSRDQVVTSPQNSSNNMIGLLPLSAIDLKDVVANDQTTYNLDETIQDIS